MRRTSLLLALSAVCSATACHADVFDAGLDLNLDYIEIGTVVTGTETIDTVRGVVDSVDLNFHVNGMDYAITTSDITFNTLTFPTTTTPFAASDNVFEQTVSTPDLTGQLAFDLHQTGSLVGLTSAEFCSSGGCAHKFSNGGFDLTDYLTLRSDPGTLYFNNFGILELEPATPTPEPCSLALAGTGALTLFAALRRRLQNPGHS